MVEVYLDGLPGGQLPSVDDACGRAAHIDRIGVGRKSLDGYRDTAGLTGGNLNSYIAGANRRVAVLNC